jgi:hypothetical protein
MAAVNKLVTMVSKTVGVLVMKATKYLQVIGRIVKVR